MKKSSVSAKAIGEAFKWWYACAAVSLIVLYLQGIPSRTAILEEVRLIRQANSEYLELKELDRKELTVHLKALEIKKAELDRRQFVSDGRKFHMEEMGKLVHSIEEFPICSGDHIVVVETNDITKHRRVRIYVPSGKHFLKFRSSLMKNDDASKRAKPFGTPLVEKLLLPENTACEFSCKIELLDGAFRINIHVVARDGETIYEKLREFEGQFAEDCIWQGSRSADLIF